MQEAAKKDEQVVNKDANEIINDTKDIKDVVYKVDSDEQRKSKKKRALMTMKILIIFIILLLLISGGAYLGVKFYPRIHSWLAGHRFINDTQSLQQAKDFSKKNSSKPVSQESNSSVKDTGAPSNIDFSKVFKSIVSIVSFEDWQSLKDTQGRESISVGSGVIVDKDGIIITTSKWIKPNKTYVVILSDGKAFPVQESIKDNYTGLVLIKIDAKDLEPVSFSASKPQIHDRVFLVGSNLNDCKGCLSEGIISSLNVVVDKDSDNFIPVSNVIISSANMLDEQIGGAFVNEQGQLIGINLDSLKDPNLYSVVIPAEHVKFIVKEYKLYGKVNPPVLGIHFTYVSREKGILTNNGVVSGILITGVLDNSLASKMGLQTGDVITEVNGTSVNEKMFSDLITEHRNDLEFKVIRNGNTLTLKMGSSDSK